MDGAPRLRQHDNVQRQLSAFEKLLKRAISRFSLDKFVSQMRVVQTLMKDSQQEINSLVQLHNILYGVTQETKNHSTPPETNVQLLRYFDAFYDDVDYLRRLKKFFDEKIYTCLYDYFYDPTDEEEEELDQQSRKTASGSDSGHVSEEADDDSVDGGLDTFYNLNPKGKLSQAVKNMYKLNQKWERILNTDLINSKDFDSDSHYEVSRYADLKWCDVIIRLVPDVFVKAYKSINLAKIWWTQANKIYKSFPAKSQASNTFNDRVKSLEHTLGALHDEIVINEQTLKQHETDLGELKNRETRADVLSESCERVEEMRSDIGQTYDDLLLQRDELCKRLLDYRPDTEEYQKIKKNQQHLDTQLRKVAQELRVLAYHQEVLQEDFHLELSLRPDIIRFIGDVELKHQDILEDLNEKKWKKLQTEKQLVIAKKNREKMKDVVGTSSTSRELTVASEVSDLSESSTLDLLDKNRTNTFTVDSAKQNVTKKPVKNKTTSNLPPIAIEEAVETELTHTSGINTERSNGAYRKVIPSKIPKPKVYYTKKGRARKDNPTY